MSPSPEQNHNVSDERNVSLLDRVKGIRPNILKLAAIALGTAYSVSSHTGDLIVKTANALERHEAGEDDKI